MTGKADPKDNVLKNAPHTAAAVTADEWTHPYSREQAAYPAAVRAREQVLAGRRPDRQPVRRPQPDLRRARRSRPTRKKRADRRGRSS